MSKIKLSLSIGLVFSLSSCAAQSDGSSSSTDQSAETSSASSDSLGDDEGGETEPSTGGTDASGTTGSSESTEGSGSNDSSAGGDSSTGNTTDTTDTGDATDTGDTTDTTDATDASDTGDTSATGDTGASCEAPGDDCGDCMAMNCCDQILECQTDADCTCFTACAAENPDNAIGCAGAEFCNIPITGLLDPNTVVGRMSACTQMQCAQCL